MPAFLAPDLVVVIEVRDVGEFLAHPQRRVLAIDADRGLQRAEVLGKIEMLVLREMLIGEDQDRIVREGVLDGLDDRGVERTRQVDIADFSCEARRNRNDGDGHADVPPRLSLEMDHYGASQHRPTIC